MSIASPSSASLSEFRSAMSALRKTKPGAASTESAKPRLLERDVVIGVEVVDADHIVAARGEGAGAVVADEAGDPGDQYPQLSPRRRA